MRSFHGSLLGGAGVGLLFVVLIGCTTASSNVESISTNVEDGIISRAWSYGQKLLESEGFGPGARTPFRWTTRTIIGAFAASFCALLANAAGIGGGPFYIPLFNTLLGFNLKLCTGLSHTVVATSAIGSCIYGLLQRSPTDPTTTLLNADLALQFVPAMLFGVSLGVVLNPISPEWLQTLLLTFLLLLVVRKTFEKGTKQWNEEQKDTASRAHEEVQSSVEAPLLGSGNNGDAHEGARRKPFRRSASTIVIDSNGTDEHYCAAHVEETLEPADKGRDSVRATIQRIPFGKLGLLVLLWAAFLFSQMLKANYKHCTWQFGAIAGGQALLLAAVTAAVMSYQTWKAKNSPGTMDVEMRKIMAVGSGDPAHGATGNPQAKLLWVVGVIAAAGFVAGLLGIGGALIFNPFLLQLGVHPQVVASTAVLIILFGSSTISLSFFFNGMLNTSYAEVYAPIAFVSSLIGVTVVGVLVRRSGRASIIILLMASIIAAGTVSTVIFGGLRSYHEIQAGKDIGFKPFCS